MSITVKPMHPDFVTEISGVDLARPLRPADTTSSRIDQPLFDHRLSRPDLTDEQRIEFAQIPGRSLPRRRRRGIPASSIASPRTISPTSPISTATGSPRPDSKRRLDWLANRLWHTDASFRAVPGALSMLYAHVVPDEGGETEFADLRAA